MNRCTQSISGENVVESLKESSQEAAQKASEREVVEKADNSTKQIAQQITRARLSDHVDADGRNIDDKAEEVEMDGPNVETEDRAFRLLLNAAFGAT